MVRKLPIDHSSHQARCDPLIAADLAQLYTSPSHHPPPSSQHPPPSGNHHHQLQQQQYPGQYAPMAGQSYPPTPDHYPPPGQNYPPTPDHYPPPVQSHLTSHSVRDPAGGMGYGGMGYDGMGYGGRCGGGMGGGGMGGTLALDHTDACSWTESEASRRTVSSHKMALAASAALEAKESEAGRLRAKAQRLLRERSQLASELEGLQETIGRMERAISRTNEQTAALQAESARGSHSDLRRHSMQLSSLAKAMRREKQRRLAARTEMGMLQKQLVKKRAQRDALALRKTELTSTKEAARQRQATAEATLAEAARLRRQAEACEAQLRTPEHSPREAAAAMGRRTRELEEELERLQQAIGRVQFQQQQQQQQQQGRAASSPPGPRGDGGCGGGGGGGGGAAAVAAAARTSRQQATTERHTERQRLLEALAAETRGRDQQAAAIAAAIEHWRQAAGRLQAEVRPLRALQAYGPAGAAELRIEPAGVAEDFADGEALLEAARWHAEARAFAAEARRVERAQILLQRECDAEREGWRDFREQVSGRFPGAVLGRRCADAEELKRVQASLAQSRSEAGDLMKSEKTIRLQLEQAGRRLQAMNEMAAELEAVV